MAGPVVVVECVRNGDLWSRMNVTPRGGSQVTGSEGLDPSRAETRHCHSRTYYWRLDAYHVW